MLEISRATPPNERSEFDEGRAGGEGVEAEASVQFICAQTSMAGRVSRRELAAVSCKLSPAPPTLTVQLYVFKCVRTRPHGQCVTAHTCTSKFVHAISKVKTVRIASLSEKTWSPSRFPDFPTRVQKVHTGGGKLAPGNRETNQWRCETSLKYSVSWKSNSSHVQGLWPEFLTG